LPSEIFEVKSTDLAGRIGRLQTKSGVLETPALLPVIHPVRQTVPISEISKLGFKAVITNAYLTLKNYGDSASIKGIHRIIDFDGVIMTDSGGYQVLEYGDLDVTIEKMAKFQESISTDIAVILDKPTGSKANKSFAKETVKATLKAAKETLSLANRKDILWTGPVQGGVFLDLIRQSAKKTSTLDFDIFALGSPTEVMETYNFQILSSMIMTAKKNLPLNKPLHLFGAGHPLTIPLAIALGCDMFDSASYILFARDDRYLTDAGTVRLKDLRYFPCICRICLSHTPKELLTLEKEERTNILALHNLHVLLKAVTESKEAIHEGRLWEHLGAKARCHPRLWNAFLSLGKYTDFFEEGSLQSKSKAVFFYGPEDFSRPEVLRHRKKLMDNLTFTKKILLILPEDEMRPLYKSPLCLALTAKKTELLENVQICFLSLSFGLIPIEVSDVFPLSQYESSLKPNTTVDFQHFMVEDVIKILEKSKFSNVILVASNTQHRTFASKIRKTVPTRLVKVDRSMSKTVNNIYEILQDLD